MTPSRLVSRRGALLAISDVDDIGLKETVELASTAGAVNIETVPVGNPGNAGELSGAECKTAQTSAHGASNMAARASHQ